MLSEIIIKDAENQPQTLGYKLKNRSLTLADQEEALKDPFTAYCFAHCVPGANIERCQEIACRDSYWAYCFAADVKGADIERCQEAACKVPEYAYLFAVLVPGADKKKCRKVCKGTQYAF